MREQQSLFSFLGEAIRNIFDLDKGFPGTFKQMFLNPKLVVDSYWNKQDAFFPPVRYIIIAGILYALLWEFVIPKDFVNSFAEEFALGLNSSAQQKVSISQEAVTAMVTSFNRYLAYITIVFLPLTAAFTFLMFKSDKQTYLKHLILNAYISGQMIMLNLLSYIGVLFSIDFYTNLQFLIFIINIIYFFWATLKCFESRGPAFKILYFSAFIIFNLIYLLITVFLMGIYVGYYSVAAG
ncbi:hypothetical protein [Kangiella sp. HZ709]|uniref:hypothetical protein n=1 Tax=Kangiella sp. HZ709 TaxID=2666328 RepID=UPI0012AF0AA8|nr:hypothetical protein [Kangiella sp. HZ709]MRX26913.1 hypothetical protein [Kangiella sp. HZ709]